MAKKAEAAVETNAKGKKAAQAEEKSGGAHAELHAMKITRLTKENPRREGTEVYRRFEFYKTGMTVGDWLEKSGGSMGNIRKDEANGHIKLT